MPEKKNVASSQETLLKVEHLCQYFKENKAVDDVSFEVKKGTHRSRNWLLQVGDREGKESLYCFKEVWCVRREIKGCKEKAR